jgi:hypothetical protein
MAAVRCLDTKEGGAEIEALVLAAAETVRTMRPAIAGQAQTENPRGHLHHAGRAAARIFAAYRWLKESNRGPQML